MEKKRTRAQDAAKGIMIIAVVFFHCLMVSLENPVDAVFSFNILKAAFPFLLSSFFFYTGYNYVPNEKSFKENILRRAKQLLIPLAFCFVVSTVTISSMELIFDHHDVGATFTSIGNTVLYGLMSEPLAQMIKFPQSGGVLFSLVLALGLLWFLYCLFICSVFFFLLVKHTNKKLSTLISVDIALLVLAFCLGQFVGNYLPYTVQCYPVVLAIMLTASYLRQSHFLNRRILCKKDSLFHALNMLIAEGIIIGVCVVCHYQFGALTTGSLPGGLLDPVLKGFDVIIAFLFSILGTYFLHTLCRLIKHIPVVGKSLQWVGNHSAIFYLFHPIFLTLTMIVVFQKKIVWGVWQSLFYLAVVMAFLVGVCLLIDLIVKKKHIAQPIKEEVENNKDPEDNNA